MENQIQIPEKALEILKKASNQKKVADEFMRQAIETAAACLGVSGATHVLDLQAGAFVKKPNPAVAGSDASQASQP